MTATNKLLSVARGEELVAALVEACAGIDGWVSAAGAVEAVELRVAGEGVDPIRALRGRFTLASLAGPVGGPYGVTLARATDAGLEVLAGELVRARSDGVTVAISVTGAAVAERASRAREPAPAHGSREVTPEKPASGWASAALASAAAVRAQAEPEPEPELPQPGDLVRHFAFGLCEVLMGDDERLKIRDLDGPGRIREIRMDMLEVRGPTDKDGKRLFRLERRS